MTKKPVRQRHAVQKLPAKVLGVDSNYEPVTAAAERFRTKYVYPHYVSKGYAVERRKGAMARRAFVAPAAKAKGVCCLTGVGHGNYDLYTGHLGSIIWQVCQYDPDEVTPKIVHLLSCRTAAELGPDMVAKGALAFFGYSENFTFIPKTQKAFFACDSEVDRALADGETAAQVHERTVQAFETAIERFREAGDMETVKWLLWDLEHFCSPVKHSMFGDPKSQLP